MQEMKGAKRYRVIESVQVEPPRQLLDIPARPGRDRKLTRTVVSNGVFMPVPYCPTKEQKMD